jgi:hypothetical protein
MRGEGGTPRHRVALLLRQIANQNFCSSFCSRHSRKRPDTIGELKSAEICVSHMPSLKTKKLEKLPQEKVLLEF